MNLIRSCQFPTDFGDVLEGTHGVRGQECRLVVGGPAAMRLKIPGVELLMVQRRHLIPFGKKGGLIKPSSRTKNHIAHGISMYGKYTDIYQSHGWYGYSQSSEQR